MTEIELGASIETLRAQNRKLTEERDNALTTIAVLRGADCPIALGVDGGGCGLCPACARDLHTRLEAERFACIRLTRERDDALAKVASLSPSMDRLVSSREAARRRMGLDGADAQALEHAITMTERERDAAHELIGHIYHQATFRLTWEFLPTRRTADEYAVRLGQTRRAFDAMNEAFGKLSEDLTYEKHRATLAEDAYKRQEGALAAAKMRGDMIAQYDARELTSRAVDELRRKADYMADAVLLVFHALNHKASRRPDRDIMRAAAEVRGQVEYFREHGFVPDERDRYVVAEAKVEKFTKALTEIRIVANRMRSRLTSFFDSESVEALLRHCTDAGITD